MSRVSLSLLFLCVLFLICISSISCADYTSSGFTYRGQRGDTLNKLKSLFPQFSGTTYASHSCSGGGRGNCATDSSDLWCGGARGGRDSRNNPQMNRLS